MADSSTSWSSDNESVIMSPKITKKRDRELSSSDSDESVAVCKDEVKPKAPAVRKKKTPNKRQAKLPSKLLEYDVDLFGEQNESNNSSNLMKSRPSSNVNPPGYPETSKPTTSEASCTNGIGAKMTASTRWTDKQTSVLVHEWKERIVELESSRTTETWQKIVDTVNKHGSARSAKQCKDKIRNLKQTYKEANQNNNQTGTSPKTSPFYDEFDEVLGSRPIITMPGVIDNGLDKSSSSTNSDSDDTGDVSETSAGKRKKDEEEDLDRASKPKKRARKEKSNGMENLTQQIVNMQKFQLEVFERAQSRTEETLMKLEIEQRKLDEESRRRDQEFFLRMAELLKK
ncbi:hypothetical protein QZH41_007553 [Actinostola sp. cb2023]|nr:hypothetical protein QZH41_007553 [Actinostola sp. cb2023]